MAGAVAGAEGQLEVVAAGGTPQSQDFYAEYQTLKDTLDRQMDAWEQATVTLAEAETA